MTLARALQICIGEFTNIDIDAEDARSAALVR